MRKYLVGGLAIVVLCVCSFLALGPPPGSNLSPGDVLEGMLTVGFVGAAAVLAVAWILGGCSLG